MFRSSVLDKLTAASDAELQALQVNYSKGGDRAAGRVPSLRWFSLQATLVVLFVGFGVGQVIATRASLLPNGKLPYSAGSVCTLAEGAKLLVASAALWQERNACTGISRSTWFQSFIQLGSVAILYMVQNELAFAIIARLGSTGFVLLGNLRIVWTTILMRLMMGRRFSMLEWLAVVLLLAAAVLMKLPRRIRSEQTGDTHSHIIGIILSLISTFCSGLCSVKNEQILKQGDAIPFMAKNALLYSWGLVLNLIIWVITDGVHGNVFFGNWNGLAVWVFICLTLLGLSCSFVLKYQDNMARLFCSVGIVFVAMVFARLLPSQHIEYFSGLHVLSLALLSVSLVAYNWHESPKVYLYMFVAGGIAALVGIIPFFIDRRPHIYENRREMYPMHSHYPRLDSDCTDCREPHQGMPWEVVVWRFIGL